VRCAARLFRDVGVLDRGQPVAARTVGQPEIPQVLPARLGFKFIQYLHLPIRQRPAAALVDLGEKLVIDGLDVFADEIPYRRQDRLEAVRDAKIHFCSSHRRACPAAYCGRAPDDLEVLSGRRRGL
jgi:hypothetical protein